MICPNCSEYTFIRSEYLYLTINLIPGNHKNHVRVKLGGTNQKALVCPHCHGISKCSLIASNLRLIGVLVMLVGFILNISYDPGGDYQNPVMILTWLLGLLGLLMIIKPNLFCNYHLELLDVSEKDLIL